MKKRTIILIVVACVGGFVALVGGIVGIVFYATSGLVEVGDRFFEAARRGEYDAAYALTAQDLRRTHSPESLKQYIEENGLDAVAGTTWNSRSFENNSGRLEGSLTTRTGGTVPITIELVKESGEWRINYLKKQRSGLESE